MRTELRKVAVAVACAVACAIAPRAQAAPADNAGAKAAFVEGERNFQLGKFDAAIDAYERAFSLDPQPAFLFNIALAHRRQHEIDGKIEHLARARELYRNYLKLEPQSSHRAGVEKLIAELTTKIDQARSRPEPPPTPGPAPAANAPVAPAAASAAPASAPAAPASAQPGGRDAPAALPPVEKLAPPADHPAAIVSAPADDGEPREGVSRKWIIGGSIAAAAVVAAITIFFVTRKEASFDGPGVNVTPRAQ